MTKMVKNDKNGDFLMIVHQTPKTSKKGIRIDFASNTGKGGYNWHTHVTIQISLIQGLIRYPPFSGFLTFLAILGFFGFLTFLGIFGIVKNEKSDTVRQFVISENVNSGIVVFAICDFRVFGIVILGIVIFENCHFTEFRILISWP